MRFSPLKKMVLKKLKNELPTHLSYHNINHTIDVVESAERIAKAEGVNNKDLKLLKTAALLHDSGFIDGPQDHEKRSCEIAQDIAPQFNYTQDQIDVIKGMIMATKIPQSPKTHLEQIIGDADLDYLGRDDFYTIGQGLFLELKHFGIVKNEHEWNKTQEKFLETHTYHTHTAKSTRTAQKNKHLNEIKQKLKETV